MCLAFLCRGGRRAFTAAACVLLAACSAPSAPAPSTRAVRDGNQVTIPDGSPLRARIRIGAVSLRTAPHALVFPATVEAEPSRLANVLSPLAGRVVAVKVTPGQNVQRGQALAVIASGDLAQAQADADKARDALDLARKTLTRTRGVAAAGGAATKDTQAARSAVNQAQAEYRRAQARLAALGAAGNAAGSTHLLTVRAPFAGTVTHLAIAPGVYLDDPTVPLLTIANIDQVWVTAQVPENALANMRTGLKAQARVAAWPARVFHGAVSSVGTVLDSDTGRDRVHITVDNADHALKPNMYARASVAVPQPAEVFVPQSALLMNNDSTSVFVETRPWTFTRRTVSLGTDEGSDTRVLVGLKPGERVIVAGGVLLND